MEDNVDDRNAILPAAGAYYHSARKGAVSSADTRTTRRARCQTSTAEALPRYGRLPTLTKVLKRRECRPRRILLREQLPEHIHVLFPLITCSDMGSDALRRPM